MNNCFGRSSLGKMDSRLHGNDTEMFGNVLSFLRRREGIHADTARMFIRINLRLLNQHNMYHVDDVKRCIEIIRDAHRPSDIKDEKFL